MLSLNTINPLIAAFLLAAIVALSGCSSQTYSPIELAPYSPFQLTQREKAQIDTLFTEQKVWDTRRRTPLSKDDFYRQLHQADRLLLGETHDNQEHHTLELMLVEHLITTDWIKIVAMEMISPAQLDNAAKMHGNPPPYDVNLQSFKKDLQWTDSGWPWQDYSRVIGTAITHSIPLAAANLNKSQIMAIYRGEDHHLTVQPNENQRHQLTQSIVDSHCGHITEEKAQPMVNIQLAKDQAMAQSITEKGSLLIAGNFHVRKDLGVPLHLSDTMNTLSIGLLENDQYSAETDFSSRYDIVIVTSTQPREDPCHVFNQ